MKSPTPPPRRKLINSDSCYNARHDLGTDGAARGVAAALGAAAALRPHLAAGAADDRGALPRLGARTALGASDAGGDDRRLHLSLRGRLRRTLHRRRHPARIRALSLLRASALDGLLRDLTAVLRHRRRARQLSQARLLPLRDAARRAGARRAGRAT